MKMTIVNGERRVDADKGKWLRKDKTITDYIYLGKEDNETNWVEITTEEKEALEKEWEEVETE